MFMGVGDVVQKDNSIDLDVRVGTVFTGGMAPLALVRSLALIRIEITT